MQSHRSAIVLPPYLRASLLLCVPVFLLAEGQADFFCYAAYVLCCEAVFFGAL